MLGVAAEDTVGVAAPGVAACSLLQAAVARATAARTTRSLIDLVLSSSAGRPTPPLSSRSEGSLTAMLIESDDNGSVHLVAADDPRVVAATEAVQAGDLDALERVLTAYPWLATARVGNSNCYRTLMHAATDWPGHFPTDRRLSLVWSLQVPMSMPTASSAITPRRRCTGPQVAMMSPSSMPCSTQEPTSSRQVQCSAAALRSRMLPASATGRPPEGSCNEAPQPG